MFENYHVFETEFAGKKISFETGKMCCLAGGSCLVRYGQRHYGGQTPGRHRFLPPLGGF